MGSDSMQQRSRKVHDSKFSPLGVAPFMVQEKNPKSAVFNTMELFSFSVCFKGISEFISMLKISYFAREKKKKSTEDGSCTLK